MTSAFERQDCPSCGEACRLLVDLDTAPYAKLPDRLMALGDMRCQVTCPACGHTRRGAVCNFEVDLDNGQLQDGTIVYDD